MAAKLAGKVVLITGGGSGIGRTLSQRFAAEGAKVLLCGRTVAKGEDTAQKIRDAGGEATFVQCDVSKKAEITRLVAETVKTYGAIDIVLHNAGMGLAMPIAELTEDHYDTIIATNLTPAVWLTREAFPHLKKSGSGRVLITSSSLGPSTSLPNLSHYASTRGALKAFVRTVALELAEINTTINCVECGMISKDDQENWSFASSEAVQKMADLIPFKRIGNPHDIANAMLFFASPDSGYITGQSLVVDGGATLPHVFTTISRGR